MQIDQARGVGTDQADAVPAGQIGEPVFTRPALGAHFAESAGHDDGTGHAFGAAVFQNGGNRIGRRGDQGQVDRTGDCAYTGVTGQTKNVFFVGMNGVDRTGELFFQQHFNGLVAAFGFVP